MNQRRAIAATAGALALAAAGLGWWWSQPDAAGGLEAFRPDGARAERLTASLPAAQAAAAAHRASSAGAADPFLSPGLRHKLEAMILEAGEASDPAGLKQRLLALVPRHFTPAEAARAAALVERYVDYRVAVGQLKPPADMGDPRALRSALEARQRVRERHFSAEEYDALFAQEAELDRYTVTRLEIERNEALTPVQKQLALRDAEQELGAAQRAGRAEAVAHLAVAAQTAAFDAGGASEQERYAQRRAQYGDAAAQALAAVDREERDWQARLSDYETARAGSPAAAAQLRERLFTREEQLRVEAALEARNATKTAHRR